MTPAERAVLATSQARDLCLSLQRAFVGPRALESLRAGQASLLAPGELRVALGLAWAARDLPLVRAALASLSAERSDLVGISRRHAMRVNRAPSAFERCSVRSHPDVHS